MADLRGRLAVVTVKGSDIAASKHWAISTSLGNHGYQAFISPADRQFLIKFSWKIASAEFAAFEKRRFLREIWHPRPVNGYLAVFQNVWLS
jgi:hypothetical protein